MLSDLMSFLFSPEGANSIDTDLSLLLFSLASGIIGLAVVFLDFLVVKTVKRNSFLKLSYDGLGAVFVFLLWGLGACLGAYIGAAAGIFEITRVASVFVAVSWTTVLPRIIDSLGNENSPERLEFKEQSDGNT